MEYVGVAQAHLAWFALRAGNVEAATDQARAALEGWRLTATAYAMEWMARWPLVELALGRGAIGEAVGHASSMLEETQQRLPDRHTAVLEAAVRAWRDDRHGLARDHLDVAVSLARGTGHL